MKLFIFSILCALVVTRVFAGENDAIFESYKREFCPQIFKVESLKENCLKSSSYWELEKSVKEAAEDCVNRRNPKAGTDEVLLARSLCNVTHGVNDIIWSGKAYFAGAKLACSGTASGKQAPPAAAK